MLKKKNIILMALISLIAMLSATVTASAASIGESWTLWGQPALYLFVIIGVVFAFIALFKIPKFTVFAIAISICGFGLAGVLLVDIGEEAVVSITPDVSWAVDVNFTASNVTISGNSITINCATNKTAATLLFPTATLLNPTETALANPILWFTATPSNTNSAVIVDNTMLAWTEASVGTIYPTQGTTREYDLITHSGSGVNRVQHINWTQTGVVKHDTKDISCAYGSTTSIQLDIDPYALALCQLDKYDSVSFPVSVAGETYTITFFIAHTWGALS